MARVVWAIGLLYALGALGEFQLPFGDINVAVVTDVHSWVAGHPHEPRFDADYGKVLSFYQRMQEECDRRGRDLFFVMNGDINDGTALGEDPPVDLVPLLQKLPWDAVTVGNHELYHNDFISYIARPGGFVEFWGDRYLTANVLNASNGAPLGRTHKFLKGKHGTRLLALGFLYNMPDHDTLVKVARVEDTVKQPWFRDLLSGGSGVFDAVLILGHMDCRDPLVHVILGAIRELQPHMPVQFVTGHSHERKYDRLEKASSSFEAGRYLDTVGFVSFPKNDSIAHAANVEPPFMHTFIDANVETFQAVSGLQDFSTDAGEQLSREIAETRQRMGVSERLGCAPTTYNASVSFQRVDSLWRLYLQEVISKELFQSNLSKVFVQSSGTFRYDLYQGNVSKDDLLTMSPFVDKFWLLEPNVSGADIRALLTKLNNQSLYPIKTPLPEFLWTHFDDSGTYGLYGGTYDVGAVDRPGRLLEILQEIWGPGRPTLAFSGKSTAQLWQEFVRGHWPCGQTIYA